MVTSFYCTVYDVGYWLYQVKVGHSPESVRIAIRNLITFKLLQTVTRFCQNQHMYIYKKSFDIHSSDIFVGFLIKFFSH